MCPHSGVLLSDQPQVELKTDTCQSKVLVYLCIWPFQGNQDSCKNNKNQQLEITQTWFKLASVHFTFSPGRDPSVRVSGRVSLRSSSYTLNFHNNAARSAYQSKLLIKELLYSCWRHIRGKCAVDLFSPFCCPFGTQMRKEGGDNSPDVARTLEGHPMENISKHSNVCVNIRQCTNL